VNTFLSRTRARACWPALLAIGCMAAATGVVGAAAEPLPEQARAFLAANCLGCHDAATASGDVTLEFAEVAWTDAATTALLQRVHRVIAKGEMPPESEERPKDAEQAAFLAWLDAELVGLLDDAAAADMLAWENSGFSIDASVRITLLDRDVPSYFQSLEHLLRYCARPPFALERLSVIRSADGRIARIRYVMPRHKAANWVGPGRKRKSTQPGANGVIELAPFEFLDRLADLIPQPRRHRHRYHGVFAPNHPLRSAVTALAVGNVGKRRDAATGGHAHAGHDDCCGTHATPRSHDTSRIAWAKLMARAGEEFPLQCPACGGDIRLISLHPSRGRGRRPAGAGSLRTGGSQAGKGHDGFACVKQHRRRSRPLAGRPPTGASSCRRMTTATSFNRHPTSCPRSTSTRCEADATSRLMPRSGEGLRRARKTDHFEACRSLGFPATTSPARTRQRPAWAHMRPHATHRPDNGCESAIDRAILQNPARTGSKCWFATPWPIITPPSRLDTGATWCRACLAR